MATKTNAETYEAVAARVIDAIETGGVLPWTKPWAAPAERPRSMTTGKVYNGINALVLAIVRMEAGYATPWWGTYRQIQARGGQVRKGEKGTQVVLFKTRVIVTDEVGPDGEKIRKRIPLARLYTVFNAAQADGLPERYTVQPELGEAAELVRDAEQVIKDYIAREDVTMDWDGGDRAYYIPALDEIHVPAPAAYQGPDAAAHRAATEFHELAHSTGHAKRLGRKGIEGTAPFGHPRYAAEELVAEFAAAMLAAVTGTATAATEVNDAAYIAGWARKLREDPHVLITGASKGQAAADYILGTEAEVADVEE
jgi:antirestriction protein ArdC